MGRSPPPSHWNDKPIRLLLLVVVNDLVVGVVVLLTAVVAAGLTALLYERGIRPALMYFPAQVPSKNTKAQGRRGK